MLLKRSRTRREERTLSHQERKIAYWAGAIFLAILADGVLRKWVLAPNAQAIPYFAKDILATLFVLTHRQPKAARLAKRLTPFVTGISICLAPAFLLGLAKV